MTEITPLFKKLNFKLQQQLLVVNVPKEFEPHLSAMSGLIKAKHEAKNIKNPIDFLLIFAQKQEDLEQAKPLLSDNLAEDALFWIAYPKGTSKKYKSSINRDSGWQVLGALGYEPVRQVAIDEDWSALRFRKVKFIKTMKRNSAMLLSKEGKERLEKGKG